MKSLLKNLGLILMIIGAAILVGVFFTGSAAINDNGVLGGSAALIVISSIKGTIGKQSNFRMHSPLTAQHIVGAMSCK